MRKKEKREDGRIDGRVRSKGKEGGNGVSCGFYSCE